MERLWSGWRAAYVTGGTGDLGGSGDAVCLFCRLQDLGDSEAYVVERGTHSYTVLNAYPYTSGHVMVAPVRHEGEMEGLSADEGHAVFAGMERAVRGIKAALAPEGVNLGANLGRVAGAGVPGHLHFHVLPRWAGDTNFMTSVAEARVLPEDLRTTWERLREAWPEAGRG